jgi:hypothetical protein
MSQDVSLSQLIEQLRRDLLSPSKDRGYPIFKVDQIELELGVNISKSLSGELSISVLQTIAGKGQKTNLEENLHKMKVILKPILSPEDLTSKIENDDRLMKGIREQSHRALLKEEDDLLGKPE